jgi:redox-sensitive bicupin YhaK (pirin superfamily)
MEIFSYVMEGTLEHKDSMGNGRQLKPGQIQLMSAGRGVTHSEFNPSPVEPLHILQIWIQPRERGLTPSYTEWHPKPEHADAAKVLVISPDGRDASATIHQDADIYRIRLKPGQTVAHDLERGRGAWLQIAEGALTLHGVELITGDGASAWRSRPAKGSARIRIATWRFSVMCWKARWNTKTAWAMAACSSRDRFNS